MFTKDWSMKEIGLSYTESEGKYTQQNRYTMTQSNRCKAFTLRSQHLIRKKNSQNFKEGGLKSEKRIYFQI